MIRSWTGICSDQDTWVEKKTIFSSSDINSTSRSLEEKLDFPALFVSNLENFNSKHSLGQI